MKITLHYPGTATLSSVSTSGVLLSFLAAFLCLTPCIGASTGHSADSAFDLIMELAEDRPNPEQSKLRADVLAWWNAQSSCVAAETELFMESFPEDSRWWKVASIYVRYSLYPRDENIRAERMLKAHKLVDTGLAAESIADPEWEKLLTWKFYQTLHNSPDVGKDSDLRRLLNQLTERIPQSEVLRNLEAQYVQVLMQSDPAAAKALLERLVNSENSALSRACPRKC
jgi:hypothetical protein